MTPRSSGRGRANALAEYGPPPGCPIRGGGARPPHGRPALAAAAGEAARTGIATRSALDECNRAIETAPMPAVDLATTYVSRAVIDLAGDNAGAAMTDTAAALRLDPALAEAHLNHGIALSAENRPGQAIAAFTQAISLNPRRPELA